MPVPVTTPKRGPLLLTQLEATGRHGFLGGQQGKLAEAIKQVEAFGREIIQRIVVRNFRGDLHANCEGSNCWIRRMADRPSTSVWRKHLAFLPVEAKTPIPVMTTLRTMGPLTVLN